jgi:hypothetical protein
MSSYLNADGSVNSGVTDEQGNQAVNSISSSVTVAAKRLFKVAVATGGSVAGTVSDGAQVIGQIPTVGGIYDYNWPIKSGSLVIAPGTGQVVSVSYGA